MHAMTAPQISARQSATARPLFAKLSVHECERDEPRVAIPRSEIQIVVRIGSQADDGLDAHAFGLRDEVHRKVLRRGLRLVMARLHVSASSSLFGVPAAELAGRIVPIADLWGERAASSFFQRLHAAPDVKEAAQVLEQTIGERLAEPRPKDARARLAHLATDRLAHGNVTAVAAELGVSERHLRRVFRETIGVSPKTFAKLTRFERALEAARAEPNASWAGIAALAGYYDQAHLIAEFRAIAGVTPRALLAELRGGAMRSVPGRGQRRA
jgi:AraC-like DNA-binding protein